MGPTRGAFGPARMQGKSGRTVPACGVLNARVHELDSRSHETDASDHGKHSGKITDSRPIKVALGKKKKSRREVEWVAVWGRETRKMGRL